MPKQPEQPKRATVEVDAVLWDAIVTAFDEARVSKLTGFHGERDERLIVLRLRTASVRAILDAAEAKALLELTHGEPAAVPRAGEFEVPEAAKTSQCRSCDAEIAWIKTAAGKNMPLSVRSAQKRDGKVYMLSHFADCPKAAQHRKAAP